MRNNLKSKADINFFFFVLHREKFHDLTPEALL